MLKITHLDYTQDVYDITVEENHNFFANDILVHNCLEIAIPASPLTNIDGDVGEIGLCTLSALNAGRITMEEVPHLTDLIVRALDSLLDYQDYPVKVAKIWAKKRRSLGVGIIGYAHFLAKNNAKYSDGSGNKITHELWECIQYNLLKASNNLARVNGACEAYDETTYSQGVLPIDRYKKSIDEFASFELKQDWEELRKDIEKYGLRNSTLSAQMPSETSSQLSNATNGIEPPRGYVSVKASKDGILKQVIPEIETLRDQYELLWDFPSNKGMLELVGIMQKFIDQSISTNTNYDPARFQSGKVPMKLLIQDLLSAYKNGVKTLYYHNTRDGASDSQEDIQKEDEECEGGGCKI